MRITHKDRVLRLLEKKTTLPEANLKALMRRGTLVYVKGEWYGNPGSFRVAQATGESTKKAQKELAAMVAKLNKKKTKPPEGLDP